MRKVEYLCEKHLDHKHFAYLNLQDLLFPERIPKCLFAVAY